MAKKVRRVEPRYAVNVSMQAWDIAKAGAAISLRVRGREGLLGTIEMGKVHLDGRAREERAALSVSHGRSLLQFSIAIPNRMTARRIG